MCPAISSRRGSLICKNTENKEAHINSVVHRSVLQESLHWVSLEFTYPIEKSADINETIQR